MIQHRTLHALMFCLSIIALTVALVAQHRYDMAPCAWCILQRMVLAATALVSGLALAFGAVFESRAITLLSSFVLLLLAIAGAVAAFYQATVAVSTISCDLSLADRWIKASGVDDVLPGMFGVFSTCNEANVVVFGLEFAWWAFVFFLFEIVLMLTGFYTPSGDGKAGVKFNLRTSFPRLK